MAGAADNPVFADNAGQIIAKQVATTPFVDTHEHLLEESKRLEVATDPEGKGGPVSDIGYIVMFSVDSS